MDAKAGKIALFRYRLIAPLVLETLPRGELTRRAEEIAARNYEIPYSQRCSLSVDTVLDWALRYRRGGFAGLVPQPRRDRGQLRALTPQVAELIELLKRENPHHTGATLLRELALVSTGGCVSPSTLYRFLKQRGLTKRQLLAPPARGILITHTPCQPEERGEIEGAGPERFLANLDPQRTPSVPELGERLGAWIEQVYGPSK
jgi:transposase